VPTATGTTLCDFLVTHFPDLFAAPYTARLEDALDAVAREPHRAWPCSSLSGPILYRCWALPESLSAAGAARRTPPTPTGETCPACGGDLVERCGKAGKFIGV
jgi:hypothetical protein